MISAEKGHIAKAPYWDVSSKFLCREDAESILQDLLTRSALPLIPIESVGIIDLTGFRTTSFHHYRHERYTPDRKNFWLTAALMVGAKSHGVLGANVGHGVMGDAPQFEPLLRRVVANGFRIKEVVGDKAFNSRVNFDVAAELGVDPYIPFKSNATGKSFGSSTYHKMFLFFTYYREKFDEHYRQRVQVESAIGAAKQKIGETVWSKNFAAQLNELLAKLAAYNITVLIRAMYEKGLVPDILTPPDGFSVSSLQPLTSRVVA
jgi:DDE family transposase